MRYCRECKRCYGDRIEFCLFDRTPTTNIPSLPLTIDDKYRIERLIAHGGMGSVYSAVHLSLDRPVAIKILRPELLADITVRERFNREARSIARLKHPNIVSIYDYGMLPGQESGLGGAYLVMELIQGRSLRAEIRNRGFIHGFAGIERAVNIMIQVCSGVEAAHRQGIIHRDLKPDNIMIENSEEGIERALVLDFGIAKLRDNDQPLLELTDEDTIIGTPNYISPEQCTGNKVDGRSDVYSLGIILYEMLAGHPPFTAQNTTAILLRHLQEQPAVLSGFRPEIGPDIERVFLKALDKRPERRHGSALKFSRDLKKALEALRSRIETEVTSGERLGEVPESLTKKEELTFLIENRRPRRLHLGLFAFIASILLISGYLWINDSETGMDEDTLAVGPASLKPGDNVKTQTSAPERSARNGETGVQSVVTKAAANAKGAESVVMSGIITGSTAPVTTDRALRDVRSVYNEWTTSAVRGDWKRHMSFYGSRVEYFRDGKLARSKVETRKRKIFSGVDSYQLSFSKSPSIRFRRKGGAQYADLTFQRRWKLLRGKKRIEGKAKGMITMRKGTGGWLIVSERQIK